MKDEWDQLADDIKHGKFDKEPKPEKQYRSSDLESIIKELRGWWSGIKSGEIKFIKGLPLLAEYLPAYIPGHVIVISGYTSAGKSQLLAQMTAYTAGIEEVPTLVISVEDLRSEKLISLVAVVSETVHRKKMLLGHIEDDSEVIDVALANISYWPLKIYDDVYTLDEIEMMIKKHNPKIVIVDYVQNLVIPKNDIYERMSYAAQRIFKLAQDYQITMIIASQVSNAGAKDQVGEVIDLKGAGELAATAHTVLQLKKGREDKNRKQVKIQVKKNKAFGNCGEIECEFNEHWTVIKRAGEEGDRWTV